MHSTTANRSKAGNAKLTSPISTVQNTPPPHSTVHSNVTAHTPHLSHYKTSKTDWGPLPAVDPDPAAAAVVVVALRSSHVPSGIGRGYRGKFALLTRQA